MDGTLIAFSEPEYELLSVSDEEFLKAVAWQQTAPPKLQRAARHGDVQGFCREWIARHQPDVKRSKVKGQGWQSLVLWSIEAFEQSDRIDQLANVLSCCEAGQRAGFGQSRTKATAKRKRSIGSKRANGSRNGRGSNCDRVRSGGLSSAVADWLNAAGTRIAPLELLALLELLMHFSAELTDDVLWTLWRTSLSAAIEFSAHLDEPEGSRATDDQRLLILGELPWLCGLLFADIKRSEVLRRKGQRFLCRELVKDTDTDGTPDAKLVERLPFWLAPLVRAAQWADWFDLPLWNNEAEQRFEALVTKVAPLCRPDGRLALSNGSSARMIALLQTASKLAGFHRDDQPLKYLLALGNGKAKPGRQVNRQVQMHSGARLPVTQSDWAQFACLCDAWSVAANSIVVAHHREKPLIDLTARGQTVLSGVWDIDVTVGGEALEFDHEWDCVCWQSDADCDYLELQAKLRAGVTVDRQVLLSRTDDFVLLADAISGAGRRLIEYTSRLPLVAGIEAESSVNSRECVLKQRVQVARAFPLALPQDRVHSTAGGFGLYADDLVLKQVSSSGGLYAPVVIEWGPRRRRSAADWRTLTVTESQKAVKSGTAAGHRLRIGDYQLFVYRSLKNSAISRAVLGHHTNDETVVGEFDATGTVTPILLVES